jgi:hypothetical protein
VFVALIIQRVKRMHRIVLSHDLSPVLYFSRYLIEDKIKERTLQGIKCVWFALHFYVKYLFSEEFGDILLQMYIGYYVKCPLPLSDFNKNNICESFLEKTLILNFIKIRLLGAVLFGAEGRYDESDSRFSKKFANAPKTQ